MFCILFHLDLMEEHFTKTVFVHTDISVWAFLLKVAFFVDDLCPFPKIKFLFRILIFSFSSVWAWCMLSKWGEWQSDVPTSIKVKFSWKKDLFMTYILQLSQSREKKKCTVLAVSVYSQNYLLLMRSVFSLVEKTSFLQLVTLLLLNKFFLNVHTKLLAN